MSKKLKTKSELLKAFMKSNKERREVLANRAGFNTPDEYKKHLESQISIGDSTPTPETKGDTTTIHNVHLLDASGSMRGWGGEDKLESALTGINNEVRELATHKDVNYKQTFITFSSAEYYKVEVDAQPVESVRPTSSSDIKNGNTALYDAIVKTIDNLISKGLENKTILKIFTDGGENGSRLYNANDAERAVNKAKEAGIVVTFVGTKGDVDRVIRTLKVDESNTLSHNNTVESVRQSFQTTMSATRSYSKAVVAGTDSLVGFYKGSGTL